MNPEMQPKGPLHTILHTDNAGKVFEPGWQMTVIAPTGNTYLCTGPSFYGCCDQIAEAYSQDEFPERDVHGGMN